MIPQNQLQRVQCSLVPFLTRLFPKPILHNICQIKGVWNKWREYAVFHAFRVAEEVCREFGDAGGCYVKGIEYPNLILWSWPRWRVEKSGVIEYEECTVKD
jgi:hypothetical protein